MLRTRRGIQVSPKRRDTVQTEAPNVGPETSAAGFETGACPERIYRRAATMRYRMYRRELLCAVAGSCALAGCNGEPSGPPANDETPDGRVELVEHSLVRRDVGSEDERAVIEGTVRISEPDLEYVELRAEFYDVEGELLDTTLERIRELEKGKQEFTVEYPRRGESAAEVEEYDIVVATVL